MLAFHGIISAYGFWLPNDPRGSWSTWVGASELFRVGGKATKVAATRSVASRPHDHHLRKKAKNQLKYPAVLFDGIQARAIARGFPKAIKAAHYTCWACAAMPDHSHVVIQSHVQPPGRILGHLKREATLRLIAEQRHPMARFAAADRAPPSCWAAKGWKAFLESAQDVRRAIRYVEQNPINAGYQPQRWSFVTQFDESQC